MNVPQLYAVVAGSLLIGFVVTLAWRFLVRCLRAPQMRHWVFRNLIFPRLHIVIPMPYYEIMLQTLYWGSNLATNIVGVRSMADANTRAAQLSVINLMPLILSSSLSLVSYMFNVSLRTLSCLHGSVALVTLAEGTFHIVTSSVMYRPFTLKSISTIFGLIITVSLAGVVAALCFRRSAFEFFLYVHIILAVLATASVYSHVNTPWIRRLIILGLSIFVISLALRLARGIYRNVAYGRSYSSERSVPAGRAQTKPEAAQEVNIMRPRLQYCLGQILRSVPSADEHGSGPERNSDNLVRIRLKVPRPWRIQAGQHVKICLPKLGVWSLLQSHPFMIGWWDSSSHTIDMIIERRKGFTSRLLDYSQTQGQSDFPVLLDGPYGVPEALENYGTVVLLADDIGITSVLPYAKQLLSLSMTNKCTTNRIVLIWRYSRHEYEKVIGSMLNSLLLLDRRQSVYMPTDDKFIVHNEYNPASRHMIHIVKVDRSAPFDSKLEHGQHHRAIEYKGDCTIESLLRKHVPRRPGGKVIGVATGKQTCDIVEKYVYDCNDPNLNFRDLSYKGICSGPDEVYLNQA